MVTKMNPKGPKRHLHPNVSKLRNISPKTVVVAHQLS